MVLNRSIRNIIMGTFFMILGVFISGCTPLIYTHGYIPLKSDQEKISLNVSNKQDINALWGPPIIIDPYHGDKWIYSYTKTRRFMFFRDFLVEKKLLVLSFNKDGVLQSKYTISNKINEFSYDSDTTPIFNRGFEISKAASLNTPQGQ